ncbi:hypothetical protein E8E11_007210 [Didymella keratinophila]|nr:hypothetical protein E8E11_007210 [Didymella keratinophila]
MQSIPLPLLKTLFVQSEGTEGGIASPITPIDKPSQRTSTFATVQEISFGPSDGTDVPEMVSSQSSTSSELSLSSLDGFSGDFAFAAPQYTPAPTADWKAPDMFKKPAASILREEPAPSLFFTAGFNPTFAFEAPRPLPQLTAATSEAIPGLDERTRFDLATAVWASASYTEPSSTDNLLMTVEAPQSLEDLQSDEPISISDSTVSSAAQVDGLEFLAITYSNIYTAALTTALAAYSEEAPRNYIRAKANLEGPHMSMEDFDLDSKLDEAFEGETEASDDERIDTSSFELSLASLLSGNDSSENSSNQISSQQEHHRVFVTCKDGRCCAVDNTEFSYDVEEPNERDSAFESMSSPTGYQIFLLEGINDPPGLYLEGSDASGEQINSQGEGAAVQAPFATDNSRFAAPTTDKVTCDPPSASQDWLTLNIPSTSGSVLCSEKLTASTGDQHSLTLTSSSIELPSKVSNYSSNIDKSPSVGRNLASMANQSPAPDHTSSESMSSSSSSADDASTLEDQSPAPAVFPDWTVELVRIRLGTESLFRSLSLLDANEEGATTKVTLITTFLTLIAAEREKLELPALPSTCTATFVLISKILPHTAVLGTTSLATFLAHFDFNKG